MTTHTSTLTLQVCEEIVEEEYLHRDDVGPQLIEQTLMIRKQGTHGTFKIPFIDTLVVHADAQMVVTLIGYHGTEGIHGRRKNRHAAKGQFWRYFVQRNHQWIQLPWHSLNEQEQEVALTAYLNNSPFWAKAPGKLKSQRNEPVREKTALIAYKIVQVRDGRFYSVFDASTEYILGQTLYQQATPGHRGGYFSYPDHEQILMKFHRGGLMPLPLEETEMVVLKVEIHGRIIRYDGGKWCSSFITPCEVLSRFTYTPGSSYAS